MTNSKLFIFAGALGFLLLALVSLYRLLFWFPITIGGEEVGQTTSLLAFVISLALSIMLFQGARQRGS
ncbi:MAG TPA: hypothetical protein VFO12_06860 [Sphingomicrobium sp.]|nr:hypothetical protein [Sphingomicrobium sp.]